MQAKQKIYRVAKVSEGQLDTNGKTNHLLWDEAESLTDFCSPWDSVAIKKIEFKALWNTEYLFCRFKVDDPEVYVDTTNNTISSINNSDRVELFFRRDNSLNPYYCLEIDPKSRLMDFKARPNKSFDFEWNWPEKDILVSSDIQSDFFKVEVAISIEALKTLGLLNNGKIETGIYRAKYNKHKNGSYEPTWITWVDPRTKAPNFHTPFSFGVLYLENFNA